MFSGREFNVSPEKGLTGFCDFLISKSSEQIVIKAPFRRQKAEGRRQKEPTLKNVGLRLWMSYFVAPTRWNTFSFLVGFIPTAKVFINTSSLLPSAFVLLPFFVIALVEAKNDNIQSGLGQCIAEMVAAQLFNQQKENEIKTVYGSVTTGTNWKFMRLSGQIIEIDLNEYFINDVKKILGILRSFIESTDN